MKYLGPVPELLLCHIITKRIYGGNFDPFPDRESALNCFKKYVENIPQERREKVRKFIESGEKIEEICGGHKIEELYTEEEINFIKIINVNTNSESL